MYFFKKKHFIFGQQKKQAVCYLKLLLMNVVRRAQSCKPEESKQAVC